MTLLNLLNRLIALPVLLCYIYPLFLQLRAVCIKNRPRPAVKQTRRYGILIAARNEEAVIGHLLESIRAQDYPAPLLHTFVVADNCTDRTAEYARNAGATVYTRYAPQLTGKGYALNWLFTQIQRDFEGENFDGFFVFDADNLLSENYITEMDKIFAAGYEIVTGCRNSKNFGDSWVSSGQALWFLRGSQLNHARFCLGTSSFISGTGFVFSRAILEQSGGWRFFLLTEDAEFNAFQTAKGVRIGYCSTAVFYDEQPVTLRQSLRQRLRWARGNSQVLRRYGGRLLRGLSGQNRSSCFDLMISLLPAAGLTAAGTCAALLGILLRIGTDRLLPFTLMTAFRALTVGYVSLFPLGLLAFIPNRNRIRASRGAKLRSILTFPLFMLTFTPVALAAFFRQVEWSPIVHHAALSLEDMKKETV